MWHISLQFFVYLTVSFSNIFLNALTSISLYCIFVVGRISFLFTCTFICLFKLSLLMLLKQMLQLTCLFFPIVAFFNVYQSVEHSRLMQCVKSSCIYSNGEWIAPPTTSSTSCNSHIPPPTTSSSFHHQPPFQNSIDPTLILTNIVQNITK